MSNLLFELGFDWNTKPQIGFRGGVFPLQVHLVDIDANQLASPANPSDIQVDDLLYFRIYDFSLEDGEANPEPATLQIIFSDGVAAQTPSREKTFSLIRDSDGRQVAQLISTKFSKIDKPSRAFGAKSGWQAETSPGKANKIVNKGRFELRALLTLENPGEPASSVSRSSGGPNGKASRVGSSFRG